MSTERRALLRRQLLKEQLAKESAQPEPAIGAGIPFVSPEMGETLSGGVNATVEATPAALTGGLQGLTFGFSDELGGMADTGVDLAKQAVSGEVPDMLGAAKKYREFQKTREAKNEALREESPLAYGLGELTGGAATMLVPGGAGLGGAKFAAGAGKLSPRLAALMAGRTGGTAGKLAGKGIQLSLEGIPAAAAYSAGMSEHGIEQPVELAKDVAAGTAAGNLIGFGLGAGTAASKHALTEALPNLMNVTDWTRKLKEAGKMGYEGLDFSSTKGKYELAKQSRQIPNEIIQQIMSVDEMLGQKVGQAIDQATAQGVKINVDNTLAQVSGDVFQKFANEPTLLNLVSPKSKQLLLKASKSGLGDLTPFEARALKDDMLDLRNKLAGANDPISVFAKEQGSIISQSLDSELKKIGPYKEAAEKFSTFREQFPEVLLDPGVSPENRVKTVGKLKNRDKDLEKGAQTVFGQAMLSGSGPAVEGPRAGLGEILGNLPKLEIADPVAMQKLGGTAEDVAKNWQNKADRLAVMRQSQGTSPHEGFQGVSLGAMVGAGEGYTYGIAGRGGRVAKGIVESKPVQLGKRIFSAQGGELMNLAQKMKANQSIPGIPDIGVALENALQRKDDVAKKAILFKLMQNPEYRNMLRDEGYNDE